MFNSRKNPNDKQSSWPFERHGMRNICSEVLPRYLGTRELAALSRVCKSAHEFFSIPLNIRKNMFMRFIEDVVKYRRLDQAIPLLQMNPNFLVTRCNMSDLAGRDFQQISVFEYLLWAKDFKGWTQLLDCLPDEKIQPHARELLEQIRMVEMKGLCFTRDSIEQVTKSFNIDNYILALLSLAITHDVHEQRTYMEIIKTYQRGAPVHVAYAICSEEEGKDTLDVSLPVETDLPVINWYQLANQHPKLIIIRDNNRACATGIPNIEPGATTALLKQLSQPYNEEVEKLKERLTACIQKAKPASAEETDDDKPPKSGCIMC